MLCLLSLGVGAGWVMVFLLYFLPFPPCVALVAIFVGGWPWCCPSGGCGATYLVSLLGCGSGAVVSTGLCTLSSFLFVNTPAVVSLEGGVATSAVSLCWGVFVSFFYTLIHQQAHMPTQHA